MWFKQLKRAPKRREVYAFDIEGSANGFICGCIVGSYRDSFYTSRFDMWGDLINIGLQGAWLFAHNLEYDLPVLAGPDLWNLEMTFTETTMLWANYRRGTRKAQFYDSRNLYQKMSVATMGEMIGRGKMSIGLDLLKQLSSGKRWLDFDLFEQEKIRRYCARDAEIVFRAVEDLQDLLLSLGGQLRPTISGCAMDLYRRKFHKYPWLSLLENTNKLAREAFYGGRVEGFRVGVVPGVNMYDVTSLYPSVMAETRFPLPNKTKYITSPHLIRNLDEWEGIAHATVDIPDEFIPTLPTRINKRLFFPIGKVKSTWTLEELRGFARRGGTIDRIHWILGSDTTFRPFEKYVEELYNERALHLIDSDPRANLVKMLLKSLYGRWGLNTEKGLYKLIKLDEDAEMEDYPGYTTKEMDGFLVAHGPIENMRYPPYVNLLFASQIASAARNRLHDELIQHGEDAIYCDTDSIITTRTIETGNGLGDWRVQMTEGTADLIAPKEYTLHNKIMGIKYVCKGVPEAQREEYIRSGVARFARAVSIREALATNKDPASWVETIRTRQPIVPKRYLVSPTMTNEGEYYLTLPHQATDLPGLLSQY